VGWWTEERAPWITRGVIFQRPARVWQKALGKGFGNVLEKIGHFSLACPARLHTTPHARTDVVVVFHLIPPCTLPRYQPQDGDAMVEEDVAMMEEDGASPPRQERKQKVRDTFLGFPLPPPKTHTSAHPMLPNYTRRTRRKHPTCCNKPRRLSPPHAHTHDAQSTPKTRTQTQTQTNEIQKNAVPSKNNNNDTQNRRDAGSRRGAEAEAWTWTGATKPWTAAGAGAGPPSP
jgi:hypothetical protein